MFEGELTPVSKINMQGKGFLPLFDLITEDNLDIRANLNAEGKSKGRTVYESTYFVNACWKSGNHGSTGFLTIVSKSREVETTRATNTAWLSWSFDTEQQAENFLAYLKTDFARAMLALYKMNGKIERGELKAIPYLDFTQEWTDEKLYKHFNVSKQVQKEIKKAVPSYY